jgi:aspartate kinase
MKIIVQKFGGTSVSTEQARKLAIEKITSKLDEGYAPVIVVSAMGRYGDPYATDSLINIVKKISVNPAPRDLDLLMSCGEIISAAIFSTLLNNLGYKSIALTGGQAGIITDENFCDARISEVKTDKIIKLIKKGIIPVIAGFQGMSGEGEITTLGRGGSDITATVLGASLHANVIEIYTDVDGVMTADPRIVPQAKVIKKIQYNEVFQLAEHGAKVIHPKAVEYAMKGNIPILVKNTYNNSTGTLITVDPDIGSSKYPIAKSLITGIAYWKNKSQIVIDYNNEANVDSLDKELLNKLTENSISIDMINFFKSRKVFIISSDESKRIKPILDTLSYCSYEITDDCCKITIIGNRISGVPGIMHKIIEILYESNIKILQTSDSNTTISCLIENENMNLAVNLLHNEFCI